MNRRCRPRTRSHCSYPFPRFEYSFLFSICLTAWLASVALKILPTSPKFLCSGVISLHWETGWLLHTSRQEQNNTPQSMFHRGCQTSYSEVKQKYGTWTPPREVTPVGVSKQQHPLPFPVLVHTSDTLFHLPETLSGNPADFHANDLFLHTVVHKEPVAW